MFNYDFFVKRDLEVRFLKTMISQTKTLRAQDWNNSTTSRIGVQVGRNQIPYVEWRIAYPDLDVDFEIAKGVLISSFLWLRAETFYTRDGGLQVNTGTR